MINITARLRCQLEWHRRVTIDTRVFQERIIRLCNQYILLFRQHARRLRRQQLRVSDGDRTHAGHGASELEALLAGRSIPRVMKRSGRYFAGHELATSASGVGSSKHRC